MTAEKQGDQLGDRVSAPEADLGRSATTSRREAFLKLGWAGLGLFTAANVLAAVRFFFPRTLLEPPARFKVGLPSDYGPGAVITAFKARYRVWIVRRLDGSFLCLHAQCTHLGCIPDWKESERIFHCPCHGSKFYAEGVNFAGPAPRPLDRYKIALAADGQLEVDRSIRFAGVGGQDPNVLHPESLLNV